MGVGSFCICRSLPRVCQRASQPIKVPRLLLYRHIHTSRILATVRPFLLSDPGEGIKEVQLIQWFVKPGDRVEQFDKVCEVASDKANIEITSRFDGVIKKLHHQDDDVVQVGQALFDVDVQSDIAPDDQATLTLEPEGDEATELPKQVQQGGRPQPVLPPCVDDTNSGKELRRVKLATPAVRGLLKQSQLDIAQIAGTGKDGRILKEDVQRYVAESANGSTPHQSMEHAAATSDAQVEKSVPLTPIQAQMFKTMTRSLKIPHFLYADEIDVTALSSLRNRLNSQTGTPHAQPKLSYLHFIIKAVSLALETHPLLNARIDPGDEISKPHLFMREKHNIGVAMDTPNGLLVPNVKDVASLSIQQIASECSRLQHSAREGKLSSKDLSGGTITVSNIGSIGGTVVAPVIVQGEVAILGVGRARAVPAFDGEGKVVRREVMGFSWSADHRVVDGATMARMAQVVKGYVEEPDRFESWMK